MVILKIPIVYLCVVVYYAIKAEPRRGEGSMVTAGLPDDSGPGWGRRRRARPGGPPTRPHGRPSRVYPRTAYARAARVDRR